MQKIAKEREIWGERKKLSHLRKDVNFLIRKKLLSFGQRGVERREIVPSKVRREVTP